MRISNKYNFRHKERDRQVPTSGKEFIEIKKNNQRNKNSQLKVNENENKMNQKN